MQATAQIRQSSLTSPQLPPNPIPNFTILLTPNNMAIRLSPPHPNSHPYNPTLFLPLPPPPKAPIPIVTHPAPQHQTPPSPPYLIYQRLPQLLRLLHSIHEMHIRIYPLAFHRVIVPHHRRLVTRFMQNQGTFHFRGPNPVPRHVHHVIHPPRDPQIPVPIPKRTIAREVVPWKRREIGTFVPLLVPQHTPNSCRPGLLDAEVTLGFAVKFVAFLVDDYGNHSEEGEGCAAGFLGPSTRERRDHVAPGFGLPPRVNHRAPPLAHHPVVPAPSLGVDGLTYGAKDLQPAWVEPARVQSYINCYPRVYQHAHGMQAPGLLGLPSVLGIWSELAESAVRHLCGAVRKHKQEGFYMQAS